MYFRCIGGEGTLIMNKKQRERIRLKYDGKCSYCGCDLGDKFHVDHLEPIVREEGHWEVLEDGNRHWIIHPTGMRYPDRDQEDNFMPSCPSCNILKSDMTLDYFRSTIQNFIHSLNKYSTQYKFAKRYGLVMETNQPVILNL